MKKNVRKNAGMLLLMMSLCGAGTVLAQDPHLLVCEGNGYTLTQKKAAEGATSYKWYENGEEVLGETGTELVVPPSKTPDVYHYVRVAHSDECDVPSNTYTVQVVATPTVPDIEQSETAMCFGAGDNKVVFWIASAANTTYTWTSTGVGSGSVSGDSDGTYTFTSPATGTISVGASASVTYSGTLAASKVCVSSSPATATADVNPLPVVTPDMTDYDACGSGVRDLLVTVDAGGSDVTNSATITWYSDNQGNSPVGNVGANYLTPSLETTTHYWVGAVTDEGCASEDLTEVIATIGLYEGEIGGQD